MQTISYTDSYCKIFKWELVSEQFSVTDKIIALFRLLLESILIYFFVIKVSYLCSSDHMNEETSASYIVESEKC